MVQLLNAVPHYELKNKKDTGESITFMGASTTFTIPLINDIVP